ncbi:hypothetical protein [Pseudomonas sp. NPDC007930]|uniref:hypothetical protein n=1 Tax=Pseudomonas sp. NPDC007930 TaxID=3364417 RepID=UPI0036E50709
MPDDQPPYLDADEPDFSLGVPTMEQMWRHQCTLLEHEGEELARELASCRRRIAKLLALHDQDQKRILRQHARIIELESGLATCRERLADAISKAALSDVGDIFGNAYRR